MNCSNNISKPIFFYLKSFWYFSSLHWCWDTHYPAPSLLSPALEVHANNTRGRVEKKIPKPSAVSWLMLAARQIWHHTAGRQRVQCSSFRFAGVWECWTPTASEGSGQNLLCSAPEPCCSAPRLGHTGKNTELLTAFSDNRNQWGEAQAA